MSDDFQLGETERAEHLGTIEKVCAMEDPDDRRPILAAAILRFGFRFGWTLRYLWTGPRPTADTSGTSSCLAKRAK